MPDTSSSPRPARRVRAGLAAALLAGLAFVGPASAWPDEHGARPVRARPPHHVLAPVPPVPPPALVSGYLPRNNNLPMYNEPPSRGPRW